MQVQFQVAGGGSTPSDGTQEPSGVRSLLATLTALAGIYATAKPSSALAQALNQALPQLSGALPQVIAAGATIVAALSHPPKWIAKLFGKGKK